MTYNVLKKFCKCHPETCSCNLWAVVDGITAVATFYDKSAAEALAVKLNKFDAEHPDDVAVIEFAYAMREKLTECRSRGRGGWETASPAALWAALKDETVGISRDPIDIANYAMMVWWVSRER